MSRASIVVVGGGVIGRTTALELARAGHDVTLLTADPPEATTSAKAAALIMPFAAYPAERIRAWTLRTIERHAELAAEPATGTRPVRGYEVHRGTDPSLDWTVYAPDAVRGPAPAGWPDGIASVTTATMPLVDMSRHLPWLRDEGARLGVRELRRRIASIDEARELADLVVLATGLETGALVPDAGVRPIQGQVVRVAAPRRSPAHPVPWLIDHEHPDGLLYVIPRIDEVVIGGTEVHGADSSEPDREVEAAMLARAVAYFPWIADAPITARTVGLRPGRSEVRLERIGDVIHCYGHGGSGVTVAVGCAEEVVALAAA